MRVWEELKCRGITSRLVLIAVVPAAMMFVAISLTLYVTSIQDVERDVQDRGRLIAASLAQSSRYGVVSGNVAYLERTLRALLAADRSIVAIEIDDWQHKTLVKVGAGHGPSPLEFEDPIRAESLDFNILDNTAKPDVTPSTTTQAAGYVRVTMSPTGILRAKRQHIYVGAGVVLLAAVLSMLVGLFMAQRLRAPLRSVMAALREIRQGRYDVRLEVNAEGDLAVLQTTIVDMARGLNVKQHELEEQVAARTRDLQVAIDAAREADAEKRRLIAHHNDLIEKERERIAAEIHDGLNASLASVRLLASSIVSKSQGEAQREVAQIAQRISDTTQELYGTVRSLVKQLRPEVIDILGLKGAVEEMVRTYDEADPNCKYTFKVHRDFPDLRGQLAMGAYRAVQEALSNIVKHACASRVTVSLDKDPNDGRPRMSIEDDGKGFDLAARGNGGLGLIGMRERVAAVGGSMNIDSRVGSGTRITLWLKSA